MMEMDKRSSLIEAIRLLENEALIALMLDLVREQAIADQQTQDILADPYLMAMYEQAALQSEADFEQGNVLSHQEIVAWATQRMLGKT